MKKSWNSQNYFQKLIFHKKAASLKVPPGALAPLATPLGMVLTTYVQHLKEAKVYLRK